jgi:aconitate decarboxylase
VYIVHRTAQNGLLKALLAYRKYSGIKKVFKRPYSGFLAIFSLGLKYEPQYKVKEVVKGLSKF